MLPNGGKWCGLPYPSSDPKDLKNTKEGNSGKLCCHGEWALGRAKIKLMPEEIRLKNRMQSPLGQHEFHMAPWRMFNKERGRGELMGWSKAFL